MTVTYNYWTNFSTYVYSLKTERRGLEIGRRPVVQSIFVYLEQIKILFIKKKMYVYCSIC